MNCKKIQYTRNYLRRFDEILSQMSNEMFTKNIVNNITLDFIECMIPHHRAAIYMSENLLKYPTYYSLEEVAKNIIQMQTREIKQMEEIANTTYNYESTREDVSGYIKRYLEIVKNMVYKMKNSPRCLNINLDFIGEMIPHHEGAVEMCNNLLKYCIDPRLKELAQQIIAEQSEGIKQLTIIKRNLCKNI